MSIGPTVGPAVRPAIRGVMRYKRSPEAVIRSLFSEGQQGFWLPFTDFASLSQDSAGTLPYTALEQPVGRVLDRSGRGNHASQVTSTARGVVSARVNLLEQTAVVNNSLPWIPGAGVSASSNIVTFTGPGQIISQSMTTYAGVGASVTASALLSGSGTIYLAAARRSGGGVYEEAQIKVTLTATPTRYSTTLTIVNTGHTGFTFYLATSADGTARTVTIGEPSLVYSNQAHLPYQRVTTPTDYDSAGFTKYLRLDGTGDSYTCGGGGSTTGFYYSDVIRLAAVGTLVVLFSNATAGKGYYLAINADGSVLLASGNGAAYTNLTTTTKLVVGVAVHIEAIDDMTNLTVVINGVAQSISAPVHNAGPLTDFNLYRGTSPANYFNGQITEPIYRAGPPPSAYERSVIRTYQMQKAGML